MFNYLDICMSTGSPISEEVSLRIQKSRLAFTNFGVDVTSGYRSKFECTQEQ